MTEVHRDELLAAVNAAIEVSKAPALQAALIRVAAQTCSRVTIGNFAAYAGDPYDCGCPLTQAGFVKLTPFDTVNSGTIKEEVRSWAEKFYMAFDQHMRGSYDISTYPVIPALGSEA